MNQERLFFTNRAGQDDQYIHIVPKGELVNHEAGIVQVLDDKSIDSILANLRKDKQRLDDRWPGLYAGEEHFIYNEEKSSQAFAWFKDFQKRPDGIWANKDGLTDIGRDAVENRRFKFTSFCADPSDVENLGDGRVRILKIDTVGFTNQANGKELLTPITNRRSDNPPPSKTFMTMSREDSNRIMNRAREIAVEKGHKDATASDIMAAQKALGFGLSEENPQVKNRGASSSSAGAGSAQPDVGSIAIRAAELQKQTPGLSLATAYKLAQGETGSAPSGALRNRSATGAEKIRALCALIYESGSGTKSFAQAWSDTMAAHPGSFEDVGIKVPDEDDSAAQS